MNDSTATRHDDGAKSKSERMAKLRELIDDISICSLVTLDADGVMRARPMATQQLDENSELWFYVHDDSAKIDNVRVHPQVCVSYADPGKNSYVSVSGTAELVHDKVKIKELWNPTLKAWFPKGVDDPELALLRVDVVSAQYWDSANSTIVQLFGMLKAMATGKAAEGGENEKVNVRHRIGSDTAT